MISKSLTSLILLESNQRDMNKSWLQWDSSQLLMFSLNNNFSFKLSYLSFVCLYAVFSLNFHFPNVNLCFWKFLFKKIGWIFFPIRILILLLFSHSAVSNSLWLCEILIVPYCKKKQPRNYREMKQNKIIHVIISKHFVMVILGIIIYMGSYKETCILILNLMSHHKYLSMLLEALVNIILNWLPNIQM